MRTNLPLDNLTKQLDLPCRQKWTSVAPYLLHPDPWYRRRAAMLFEHDGGLLSLEEVLQGLDRFPEDILQQALDWLRQWQWPATEAPGSSSLKLCIKLVDNPDARIAAVGRELLGRLNKHKWPGPLKEEAIPYHTGPGDFVQVPLLTIHLAKSEVWLGHQQPELTRAQRRILFRLAEARGNFLEGEILYYAVQGETAVYGYSGDVKSHIKLLRQKLGDDAKRQLYIESKRSRGYRLNLTHVQIRV
ncbi:Transcriptional regulatory protein, C terminal [Desulforamulus putei DSM 12395]|uniref:Transcriptional regulatory protein, C terminal n=1 Tax=Desulforamulus putei DSM 12395 TaxID=1121429 RepID=A0A1M4SZ28_9FIRM|nr:winged helix-turn-helix domain-containing protein [Desulforamulus putei]SHE37404.1 Transcriptional regulatory protein, C terminal [Desulforamulus putei DSM 12395]